METLTYHPERAHQRYVLSDGEEVIGASSIAKVDDDPGRLIGWAWGQGRKGLDCHKTRDQAAEAGSVGHFMIQCFFLGKQPDFKKVAQTSIEAGEKVFKKFQAWWEENELIFVASELELVSEVYRYGGTTDIVARDQKDQVWMIDIKTGKSIYPSNWYQIAGLGELWRENYGEPVYKHLILRLPRTNTKMEEYLVYNPEECLTTFLCQLAFINSKKASGGYK